MKDFSHLDDKHLYDRCKYIGGLTLKYRKQFLGMLPEVARRKLYEKYKMHSIYEFAAKLAGVSHDTVNEIVRLDRSFEDKPLLRGKLTSGDVSYTKLRAVAKVVTPETQKQWMEKVETMSKPTLETYVREIKRRDTANALLAIDSGPETGFTLPGKEAEAEETVTLSFKVAPRTAAQFRVYKQRLEKKHKKVLNWDETLRELLREQSRHPAQRGRTTTTKHPVKHATNIAKQTAQPIKRHIHAEVRHEIENKYSGMCAFPGCTKAATSLHHTERFALKPEHNPKTIVPLCTEHERIAHHGLVKNEEKSPDKWRLLSEPDKTHPKYAIDRIVQGFRRPKPVVV